MCVGRVEESLVVSKLSQQFSQRNIEYTFCQRRNFLEHTHKHTHELQKPAVEMCGNGETKKMEKILSRRVLIHFTCYILVQCEQNECTYNFYYTCIAYITGWWFDCSATLASSNGTHCSFTTPHHTTSNTCFRSHISQPLDFVSFVQVAQIFCGWCVTFIFFTLIKCMHSIVFSRLRLNVCSQCIAHSTICVGL